MLPSSFRPGLRHCQSCGESLLRIKRSLYSAGMAGQRPSPAQASLQENEGFFGLNVVVFKENS